MHFMEALTPYFHILLEFLLGTQIKPASPSTAVCPPPPPPSRARPRYRHRILHREIVLFILSTVPRDALLRDAQTERGKTLFTKDRQPCPGG